MKTFKIGYGTGAWLAGALALTQFAAWLLAEVIHDPLASKKLPYLKDVAASFFDNAGYLLFQAGVTMRYAALGFFLGAAVGAMLALLMRASGLVERMLLPYLLLSQMIPIIGLAPIIFGLFKSLNAARIIIAAYITFFPVSISLLSGLKSVDQNRIDLMHSYAATPWQRYTKLLIPWSVPYLFTGLKIAAPVAVSAAVLVDTLSSRDGIGYVIVLTLYGGGTTGQFWPALILAALIGLGSMLLITALEKLCVSPGLKNGKGVV